MYGALQNRDRTADVAAFARGTRLAISPGMQTKFAILSAALVSLTTLAIADHPHHGPPPEAVDACSSKAAGDTCSGPPPR
jgi:hypothetical protein